MAGAVQELHPITRSGLIHQQLFLFLVNLAPLRSLQLEVPLHSQCWCMEHKATMKMRLGGSDVNSHHQRSPLQWSERDDAEKKKSGVWRKSVERPAPKNLKGSMRSNNNSRAQPAAKPPASTGRLLLPQPEAPALHCQHRPPTPASPLPPVWTLRSLPCQLRWSRPLWSLTDSGLAVTAAMTLEQKYNRVHL